MTPAARRTIATTTTSARTPLSSSRRQQQQQQQGGGQVLSLLLLCGPTGGGSTGGGGGGGGGVWNVILSTCLLYGKRIQIGALLMFAFSMMLLLESNHEIMITTTTQQQQATATTISSSLPNDLSFYNHHNDHINNNKNKNNNGGISNNNNNNNKISEFQQQYSYNPHDLQKRTRQQQQQQHYNSKNYYQQQQQERQRQQEEEEEEKLSMNNAKNDDDDDDDKNDNDDDHSTDDDAGDKYYVDDDDDNNDDDSDNNNNDHGDDNVDDQQGSGDDDSNDDDNNNDDDDYNNDSTNNNDDDETRTTTASTTRLMSKILVPKVTRPTNIMQNDVASTVDSVCLIHVGKTSGSMIGCVAGIPSDVCLPGSKELTMFNDIRDQHSSSFSSSSSSITTTTTTRTTEFLFTDAVQRGGYTHMRGFGCDLNSDAFLITTRNPIDRIISWFSFEKVTELLFKDEYRSYGQYKRTLMRSYLYIDCYSTIEQLIMDGLTVDITSDVVTMNGDYTNMTCPQRAWATITGARRSSHHNWYNYEYYTDLMNKFNHNLHHTSNRKVFVIRHEHISYDWNIIDTMFGGSGTLGEELFNMTQLRVNMKHKKENSLSKKAYSILCDALCIDIQYYKRMLLLSLNLDDEQIHISMKELQYYCPKETSIDIRHDCPLQPLFPKVHVLDPHVGVEKSRYKCRYSSSSHHDQDVHNDDDVDVDDSTTMSRQFYERIKDHIGVVMHDGSVGSMRGRNKRPQHEQRLFNNYQMYMSLPIC